MKKFDLVRLRRFVASTKGRAAVVASTVAATGVLALGNPPEPTGFALPTEMPAATDLVDTVSDWIIPAVLAIVGLKVAIGLMNSFGARMGGRRI